MRVRGEKEGENSDYNSREEHVRPKVVNERVRVRVREGPASPRRRSAPGSE